MIEVEDWDMAKISEIGDQVEADYSDLIDRGPGARLLALAIIGAAAEDFHSRDPRWRKDAEKFFRSNWYNHLRDTLGIAPGRLPVGVDLARAAAPGGPVCKYCGGPLPSRPGRHSFCSDACRAAYVRARRAEKIKEKGGISWKVMH